MSLTYAPEVMDDDELSPPLWRDAVVGASIAAMAAAAGFGTHYEVGAAPWLSTVAAGVTVAALWGAHRQFGQRRVSAEAGPLQTRSQARRPAPEDKTELSSFAQRPANVAQKAAPAAAPLVAPTEASSTIQRAPHQVAPRAPQAQPTPVVLSPAPAAAPMPPSLDLPMSAIDPEAQFLHLQGLVRQLAAEVPGPRAQTSDPDRSGLASASEMAPPPTSGAHSTPAFRSSEPAAAASPMSPLARLAEAVAAERFDVLLEPIQALAEARTRHFEISLRFRDTQGNALPPDETARIARSTGLATSIDVLKLPRVAKVVQRVKSRGGSPSDVLTLLAGASLADHHFMEAFANAFPVGVPGQLVLSFAQADVRAFARVHWGALNALADMGLRYALADVSDLDMDFELLRARSFVFAKLEAGVFLDGLPCSGVVVSPGDICGHLSRAGLEVIVAGLDNDRDLGRIVPFGVMLGQGRLFGGARPVKADVLQ